MNTEIIVALIALLGSAIGTFAGVVTSSRLTSYRIEQLEKKVDKHNTVVERTFLLEKEVADNAEMVGEKFQELTREVQVHNDFARRIPVIEEQIKVVNHRVSDLEEIHKHNG